MDVPCVGGRGWVDIVCSVDSTYLESVAAWSQARVVLRAGAGREAAAVQLALEGQVSRWSEVICARERECGITAATGVGRAAVNGRVRRLIIKDEGHAIVRAGRGCIAVAYRIRRRVRRNAGDDGAVGGHAADGNMVGGTVIRRGLRDNRSRRACPTA